VRRSSGSGALDEAALTILKLASPFDPFPADLAAATPTCALLINGISSPARCIPEL
jgi:outer membrane biosynthesis protein TonB